MARPRLLNPHENSDGDTVFEFSENVAPVNVEAGFDPTAFHRSTANNDPEVGVSIADSADDTITVHFEPGPPGFTSVAGATTLLNPRSIKSGATDDIAFPFVNRSDTIRVTAVEHHVLANQATIHWSAAATGANFLAFSLATPAGEGKQIDGLAAGDGTDTWTVDLTDLDDAPPAGTWRATAALALDADGNDSGPSAGPLTTLP